MTAATPGQAAIPLAELEAAAAAIMTAQNANDDEPERFEAMTLARAALGAARDLAAQGARPAPEARAALAADVHELIDGYCPDIPMCPKCERRKRELLDLADDYAAAAAPAAPDAEGNARLRAQVAGLRAQIRAARQLAELGTASGIIDSRALLGLLEASRPPRRRGRRRTRSATGYA